MTRLRTCAVGALFSVLLSCVAAAQSLDDLAFMEGRWDGEDGSYSEWWMPSDGRAMVATFRWTMEDQTVLEFLVIEETEDGPVYRFSHFSPAYEIWEDDGPNVYALAEVQDNFASFRMPEPRDGVPAWLIYTREGDMLTICADDETHVPGTCGGFELTLYRQGD